MLWYAANCGHDRKKQRGGQLNVHCITDSQITARLGTSMSQGPESQDRVLREHPQWGILVGLQASGYRFHFHWKPRAQLGLNCLADYLAAAARLALEEVKPPAVEGRELTVYDLNCHMPS